MSLLLCPRKRGGEESSISAIWLGEPFPKNLLLLDDDFFGSTSWRQRIREIREVQGVL
jgi:hypothetical protein